MEANQPQAGPRDHGANMELLRVAQKRMTSDRAINLMAAFPTARVPPNAILARGYKLCEKWRQIRKNHLSNVLLAFGYPGPILRTIHELLVLELDTLHQSYSNIS